MATSFPDFIPVPAGATAGAAAPGLTSMFPPMVSAVVVSYNTGPLLPDCLDSLLAQPEILDLIVVDNGNDPETRAIVKRIAAGDKRVRIVCGQGNIGFGAGCNLGSRQACGRFLLLVNPDCVVTPKTIANLMAAVGGRDGHWVITPQLIGIDGTEQAGARRNHAGPWRCLAESLAWMVPAPLIPARWRVNLHQQPLPSALTCVPAISGAFMLMPLATYRALNGMDERYFLHFEDLDFCLRLRNLGGTALFLPSLQVVHSKSSSQASPLFIERQKTRSLWIYLSSHYQQQIGRPLLSVIWAVIATAMIGRGWLRLLLRRLVRRGSP